MPEYRSSVVINFIIRAIIGFTLIFFINQFLSAQGVGVRVGLNPATFVTSGIFGAPVVALLYGISFYQGI